MRPLERPFTGRRASALILSLAALCAAMTACAQGPRVEIVGPDGKIHADVAVEIASTPQERETGLMYRNHLGANDGMIFLFTHPQPLTFWMKNTEIPLDMIFADANRRIVGTVIRAEPYSEQLLSVGGDSQYVLEVNGGFCQAHQIQPGDHLKFMGFADKAED
jgi:uncharacterized protein